VVSSGNTHISNSSQAEINMDKWITINAKSSNKLGKSKSKSVTKTTGTSTQYVLLSNFKELDATTETFNIDVQETAVSMISESNNCSLNKHNILITGESHAEVYLEKISYVLGITIYVIGIVKPNSDLETITSAVKSDNKQLIKNDDDVTVCGGSINIARNNSKKGFHSLKHFFHKISNTNIITMDTQHI
jgi:primosomal protein N'